MIDRVKLLDPTADVDSALENLRARDPSDAMHELLKFKGIGEKLAACVLSFTCKHPWLAVDSNVANMAQKLGWYTGKKVPKKDAVVIHNGLNGVKSEPSVRVVLPTRTEARPHIRLDLHCLLLHLGIMHDGKDAAARRAVSDFIREWKLNARIESPASTYTGGGGKRKRERDV